MSDFLIMFLLYSCLSSVGCWSIEWRMRLEGGLSLHKQSSRVPGKSSFLTNKSGEVHYKTTMRNLWRWRMSCLLSEPKVILALGWPGKTEMPGRWVWCPTFVVGADLSHAVPQGGLCIAQLSVLCGQAELWCAPPRLVLARNVPLLENTELLWGISAWS